MNIVILDIETTGFIGQGGKIVELGMVLLNLKTGDKSIFYDKVFNPGLSREVLQKSWICQNGWMKPEDILNGFSLEEEKKNIQNCLDVYGLHGVTAYNNKFDFDFLESEGIKIPKKLACPMKLSTNICKIPSKSRYGGYKWPKVQEAWDFFFGTETGYIEQHRGADDAFHEADIVLELYKRGVFKV